MKSDREKNFEEFGTGTVTGIVCNKCGATLPEIFAVDHLDPEFSVNKCPHTPVYTINKMKNTYRDIYDRNITKGRRHKITHP